MKSSNTKPQQKRDDEAGKTRLWAPWRMKYIEAAAQEAEAGCFLCMNPTREDSRENLVLHRGKFCFIIMNLYPYNSGHVMVVPYKHTSKFEALSEGEYVEVMQRTARMKAALEKVSHPPRSSRKTRTGC